jgi:DHA1 family bicyclomycin/chloramphenicol resistance-like MFS transporter
VLGAAQFGVAAAVAPLVGVAGSDALLPMAVVMTGASGLALTLLVALTGSRSGMPG